MAIETRDPYERAGAILGYVIGGLLCALLVYAMLPSALPWLYR